MDRFLLEVNDEAHMGAHASSGSSDRAPASVVPGGAGGFEDLRALQDLEIKNTNLIFVYEDSSFIRERS